MSSFFSNLQNLDLLSIGIAVAGMMILGFVIFFNNSKSVSNRIFLYLAMSASAWGIVNYSFYQIHSTELSFWILRLVMFFAVWSAFFVFTFSYVFPSETVDLSRYYKWILIPLTTITAFLTLTPLVFTKIVEISADGRIIQVTHGPGIVLFGIVVAFFNLGSVILLIQKIFNLNKAQRQPLQIVLLGVILMLFLIMIFNFILPAIFGNSRFVPLGAIFLFPFIMLTAYAILKHHFLNVKIITTEILTFVLSIAVLYEVIFAENLTIRILRSGIFLVVLGFSILLIRSVRKEVEQREKLQELTGQLKATNLELESANMKLKELDNLKSEFLSFASHQVKSPMAVVKGWATLILDGTSGAVSDDAKDKAKKIKDKADQLILLVNNLLDLRKIEEGKMEFTFQDMDIVSFVNSMVEEYKPLAKIKGLALSFESSVPSIKIKGDAEKIRQVIQNLIDNSIKYTDQGYVKVSVKDEGDKVSIMVSDSGHGLSKELQAKLFQQFVRDEKTKREIQGTGLGLYIAKQIVTAHKGEIWAESDGEGQGSRFYVRLSKR